ncbi:MAG: T9SS type A sorting domain-containing protein [Bacteroidetes bacterium]|nr:T9SS type A sorting domain-containing protein [Bacteroidota bacterium]
MKKSLFTLLLLLSSFWAYGTFPNGDFEQHSCQSGCTNPLSCAPGWVANSGNPQILYFGSTCEGPVCSGFYSLYLSQSQGFFSNVRTSNPFFGADYIVPAVILDAAVLSSSATGTGKIQVFGKNTNGSEVLLAESECIPASNLSCQQMVIPLPNAVADYPGLVFQIYDCSGQGNIGGVIDNLEVCDLFQLNTTTPECDLVCFEIEDDPCGVDLSSQIVDAQILVFEDPNDNEPLFDILFGEPTCIQIEPGEAINFSMLYIMETNNQQLYKIERPFSWTQPAAPQTTAEFIITDYTGEADSIFCAGESIYFQNTTTSDEAEWFIQICMRDIDDPTSNYPCLEWNSIVPAGQWMQGEVPDNPIDLLTEVWQQGHPDWEFWAGYQYTVGLAVRNLPCETWVSHDVTFIVTDCEVDASFAVTQIDSCTYCFHPTGINSDCVDYFIYNWDFGDGHTETRTVADTVCHTYEADGNYNVVLTLEGFASDPYGDPAPIACDMDIDSFLVCPHQCDPEPECFCEITNNGFNFFSDGCAGVIQIEEATPNECTEIVAYIVDWDDDVQEYLPQEIQGNINYLFDSGGQKNICLSVVGVNTVTGDTCTQTICDTFQVNCDPCLCDVTNNGFNFFSDGCAGVMQLSEATSNECTEILTYIIDWEDSQDVIASEDFEPTAFFTFEEGGTKTICLTVIGEQVISGDTCSQTICDTFQVNCDPEPCTCGVQNNGYNFSTDGCALSLFPNLSTANECTVMDSLVIDWGIEGVDPITVSPNTQNINQTYPESGNYPVCTIIYGHNPQTGEVCSDWFCFIIPFECSGNGNGNGSGDSNSGELNNGIYTTHKPTFFHPNPAKDWLYLDEEVLANYANGSILIYNATGQLLLNKQLQGQSELDISSLPPGMYYIGIKTAEGIQAVEKLIKE